MRTYLKLGSIAAGFAGALAAAVYFVPDRIDVDAYKPALIEAVREATGRELVIDGRMRLRLFPVPGIGVGRVRFADSAAAGPGPKLMDVRWISVRPSWSGLLAGRVEIGRLALVRPTIELETDASGRSNWDFVVPARTPGESNTGMRVPIGKLEIIKGTVRYADRRTGQTIVAEEGEATATAATLSGPMTLAGTARVNGLPAEVALDIGPPTPHGNTTVLKVRVLSGELDFKGSVSRLAPDAVVKGHLKAETGLLADFIADLMRASGAPVPDVGAAVSGRFTFDGGIELSP
ncbi:MAG: AsmA family protein, partial [Alphaproteobacteria bacterium]|nr:AsmA family protein [Alphaproteobacteria bacterium]